MLDETKGFWFYVAMTFAIGICLVLLRMDGLSTKLIFVIGVPVLTLCNLLYLKARNQPRGSAPRRIFEWVAGLSTIGLAVAHLILDRH